MRILLDTHVVVSLLRRSLVSDYPLFANTLTDNSATGFVSVASLWEIAIKTRLGKLDAGIRLSAIAGYVRSPELDIVPIDERHAIAAVEPDPATKDPFDRLLLAQCAVENLVLMTVDRALVGHRLTMPI